MHALTRTPGYWTYPCNTNLEEIALVLGGEGYPLNIEDFNIGILSDDKPDRCVGGIAGMDLPGSPDVGIVGDLWMKVNTAVNCLSATLN